MYEHSTAIENLRQVTLTTDPDTENEETFSVQVPKGDGVVIYLPEGYDGIFTDQEPHNDRHCYNNLIWNIVHIDVCKFS